MARKALSLLIVVAIIATAVFLLKKCESDGGGLSPLAHHPIKLIWSK